MAQVECRLWWYRALHHLVADALARNHLGHNARVLDAGCGTGGLMIFLRDLGYCKLSGFDVSPEAVAVCQQRNLSVQAGDLRHMDHFCPPASAEVIVSNDTLYFFSAEERARILTSFLRTLVPEGWLILNVPALQAFRGIHDLSVGVSHRFSRSEMESLLASIGLRVQSIRYWPFLLSPLIYLKRFSQRVRLKGARAVEVRSDIDLPPRLLNHGLELITRLENALLPWKPFGSSLFIIAQKSA